MIRHARDLTDQISHFSAEVLGRLTDISLPASLDLDTALALAYAQAERHGVSWRDVPAKELEAGIRLDPRVSAEQISNASHFSERAQLRFFSELKQRESSSPQKILMAPTSRVVDHVVGAPGMHILIRRLVAQGQEESLRRAINDGPGDGAVTWDKPSSPIELVASMVRWSALRRADKRRLRPGDEVRGWIGETLQAAQYETRPRLGGVSAVCSALAPILGDEPTMVTLGSLPPEILRHLPASTRVVNCNPEVEFLYEIPRDKASAGHYCISSYDGTPLLPEEFGDVQVNGVHIERDRLNRLDTLVTGVSVVPGFGMLSLERMRELGSDHSVTLLTGMQNLRTLEEIHDYCEHVHAMHAAGTAIALIYAEPKFPDAEPAVWRELIDRRVVEFLGLNTVEAHELLKRIFDRATQDNPLGLAQETIVRIEEELGRARGRSTKWESGAEDPASVVASAILLQDILQIPLVRVRAKMCDILVTSQQVSVDDPDRVRDHLIVSRMMGTLKVANPSGLLDRKEELCLLLNIPDGRYLAAMYAAGDEIMAYNWSLNARPSRMGNHKPDADVAFDGIGRLADGRHCFVTAPIPFYVRAGGTQSAGDTMDYTFMSLEGQRLMHAARLQELA